MNQIWSSKKLWDLIAGKSSKGVFVHCLLIVFVCLLAYSNTFYNSFIFDDIDNINLNNAISSFSASGDYGFFLHSRRGVGYLSFLINYRLGGLNVFGYHLFNIAIHLANALLVYGLVLTTANKYRNHEDSKNNHRQWLYPALIAFFPAMLFAAHPVQTQAVTYVVQRFTSLCTLFYLAGILCYALARRVADKQPSPHIKLWGWLATALICFILASRTKEIAFTFPFIVLLYEFMFFRTDLKQRLKYLLLPAITPLMLAVLVILKTLLASGVHGLDSFTKVQTTMSRLDYLLTQFRVIITYIRLMFFPVNQSIDYDYPISTSLTWPVALSALTLLFILMTAIWLWLRSNRVPPSPDTLYLKLMAFGIIWFFVTLSIESSIIPIIDVIFEHRLYLPSTGALIAITTAIMYGVGRIRPDTATLRITIFLILTITLVLAFATYKRNAVWANDLTLWQDAYKKAPHKSRVANNYAAALILRGKGEDALPLLIASIEREPGYFAAWNNLPRVFAQIPFLKGHYRSGFEMLKKDGDVDPIYVSKWFSNALNNLGVAYLLQNNIPKAFDNYRKALEINPSFSLARENALSLISALPDRAQASRYSEQMPKIPSQ